MYHWFSSEVIIAFSTTFLAGLATLIGGAIVLFFKKPSFRLLSFGLAFSAGAMVYISLTEILNKSIDSFTQAYDAKLGFALGTFAFLAGVIAILILDRVVPNPHELIERKTQKTLESQIENNSESKNTTYTMHSHDHTTEQYTTHVSESHIKQPLQFDYAQLKRTAMLTMLAITAHNLPEGLATFFSTLESPTLGAPLAIAIAIHNIPEGVAIAVPVYIATQKKSWALMASLISGLAEPFGAVLGYFALAPFLGPTVYGVIFGLIAGVMVYLALDELLPTAKRYSQGHETVYGLVSGMAVLAISLVLFKLL